MAQGTHRTPRKNNRPPLLADLDTMIVSRALRPERIKLGGRLWTIKRDFTAEQILAFHMLTTTGKAVEAFTMLVGPKDAPDFAQLVLAAPTELMTPALRRLYRLAGLLKRDDFEPATEQDGDSNDGGDHPDDEPNAAPNAGAGTDGDSTEEDGAGESSAS